MNRLRTSFLAVALLATGIGVGAIGAESIVTPASAQGNQQHSNSSIWRVRHHIENEINILNGDAHDYGGHRAAAINQLQAAHGELMQAEQYARSHGY